MKPRNGTSPARGLRTASTDAESLLWKHIRARRLCGAKFRRQFPIAGYIVDFVCLEAKLIVEVDGSQHADNAAHDALRTGTLRALGYRVMRFWNNDALQDTEAVLIEIASALIEPPSPHPSPASGRGGKSAERGNASTKIGPALTKPPSPQPSPASGRGGQERADFRLSRQREKEQERADFRLSRWRERPRRRRG
ncbi:MAG: endonuclease domain-containing protein [Xanthomonadaceae bacterium]|nr:endonuclease domain-containing protein [Xanthomonadaceae bacterium]